MFWVQVTDFKPKSGMLIKAMQPIERLNIDFKGSLPSERENRYMLTVIDEYSWFPLSWLINEFSDMPMLSVLYFWAPRLHPPRLGKSFMSKRLRKFLHERGVATSQTTPYHPQGNGQCEQYNGIIWKNIQLATANRKVLLPTGRNSFLKPYTPSECCYAWPQMLRHMRDSSHFNEGAQQDPHFLPGLQIQEQSS